MNKTLMIVLSILVVALFFISCSVPGGMSKSSGSGDSPEEGDADLPAGGDTGEEEESEVEEGLVVGFTFEEGADEPVYEIVGAEWTEGIDGTALSFNGYDQYILIEDNDALDLSTEGSVTTWIKASSHRPYAGIVHKGELPDFSDESWMLQFWGSQGQVGVIVTGLDGTMLKVLSTFDLNLDEWYYIAATWDVDNVTLYINGQLNNTQPNTIGEVRATDGGLVIGAQLSEPYNDTYGNVGFDGIIDEVGVFDRVLSADEILARFDAVVLE